MLEPMKKRHIEIRITGPAEKKSEALVALKALGYTEKDETGIPWREAFPAELRENEAGICLKVTRERKGLSQTALARMSGIPQPHISEMEGGKRPIGKKNASLLGNTLDVNYRVFL
jgi:hypothetical protein